MMNLDASRIKACVQVWVEWMFDDEGRTSVEFGT
jgi:hypothetical protein